MRKTYNLDHFGVNFPSFNFLPIPFHSQQTPLMNVKPIPSVSGHQQVTIFFNGRPFNCDMTELQARAIILIATGEMQERRDSQGPELALSVCLQSQIWGSPGLSVKRSLQRFLQKRKRRSQASSPYNYPKATYTMSTLSQKEEKKNQCPNGT